MAQSNVEVAVPTDRPTDRRGSPSPSRTEPRFPGLSPAGEKRTAIRSNWPTPLSSNRVHEVRTCPEFSFSLFFFSRRSWSEQHKSGENRARKCGTRASGGGRSRALVSADLPVFVSGPHRKVKGQISLKLRRKERRISQRARAVHRPKPCSPPAQTMMCLAMTHGFILTFPELDVKTMTKTL